MSTGSADPEPVTTTATNNPTVRRRGTGQSQRPATAHPIHTHDRTQSATMYVDYSSRQTRIRTDDS